MGIQSSQPTETCRTACLVIRGAGVTPSGHGDRTVWGSHCVGSALHEDGITREERAASRGTGYLVGTTRPRKGQGAWSSALSMSCASSEHSSTYAFIDAPKS